MTPSKRALQLEVFLENLKRKRERKRQREEERRGGEERGGERRGEREEKEIAQGSRKALAKDELELTCSRVI